MKYVNVLSYSLWFQFLVASVLTPHQKWLVFPLPLIKTAHFWIVTCATKGSKHCNHLQKTDMPQNCLSMATTTRLYRTIIVSNWFPKSIPCKKGNLQNPVSTFATLTNQKIFYWIPIYNTGETTNQRVACSLLQMLHQSILCPIKLEKPNQLIVLSA